MKIEIVNNSDDFLDLKNDWDSLYNLVNCSAFQSFNFNYYSWISDLKNNKRNQLAIAVIKKKLETVAIFPFYVDAKRQLRFINDVHADFCDCISREEIDLQQLFSFLKKTSAFNTIHLINIKDNASIKTYFKIDETPNSLLLPFERYAFINLEKGIFPDNYLKFKSKQKTEFRRIQKKNNDKKHFILSAETEVLPKSEILVLKEKMIALGFRKKYFLPKSQLTLIEELYNKKLISLSIVRKENKIHALSFVLKKSNEYLFWIDMFDESKMVNLFNYTSIMSKLSSENAVCMNLGRGLYNYKIVNFNPKIAQLYAIHIFNSKMQLLIFQSSNKILKFAKSIYKRLR
ncbi:MAG: hypothetical protein VYD71_01505 [Bacteroidota bacterium]|nr:hypothetical protein [Bacteroidota bacterium]